jgi:NAD(P)-dependent dehydrogenase (short-subunit alcohol dehydrogenase family)
MDNISEKTILITGATDGLGLRTAESFVSRGAQVLLHGRDPERVAAAMREIEGNTGNEDLNHYLSDLSSFEQVRSMAEQIRSGHGRLDILVNNAGVIVPERRETGDGVELTFAVNYLSHFLLTRLLLPLLRESAPARIVNVASAGQRRIDFDDVMLRRGYDPMRAYAQSKLAMIMDAFELAEELEGTGVTANALHPATFMDTKMVREAFGATQSSVREGVEATLYLAASPELEDTTGQYFDGKRQVRADRQAYDESARERLRRLSEELTGLWEPR